MHRAEIGVHETVTVEVDVTNSGDVTGDEVVQMYVTDIESTVVRPQLDLRGFQRVTLEPGQTVTVAFELAAAQLGYYTGESGTGESSYVVEPGDFRISAGRSSADLPLAATLTVVGGSDPMPADQVFFSRVSVD